MEIETIYKNIEVTKLAIEREQEQYSVYFEFTSKQGDFEVRLGGLRDIDNLLDLFEAERIWLEEENSSQVEYGRYTLGISHESYSTVVFDEIY